MSAPSIDWPFGGDYTISRINNQRTRIEVTGKLHWWQRSKTFVLRVVGPDEYIWEHNGHALTLCPRPVWMALRAAVEVAR